MEARKEWILTFMNRLVVAMAKTLICVFCISVFASGIAIAFLYLNSLETEEFFLVLGGACFVGLIITFMVDDDA